MQKIYSSIKTKLDSHVDVLSKKGRKEKDKVNNKNVSVKIITKTWTRRSHHETVNLGLPNLCVQYFNFPGIYQFDLKGIILKIDIFEGQN